MSLTPERGASTSSRLQAGLAATCPRPGGHPPRRGAHEQCASLAEFAEESGPPAQAIGVSGRVTGPTWSGGDAVRVELCGFRCRDHASGIAPPCSYTSGRDVRTRAVATLAPARLAVDPSDRNRFRRYIPAMRLQVVEHPLVAHKLTVLRDERTEPDLSLAGRRAGDSARVEATRDARVAPLRITTPVGPADGVKLSAPKPLVVPILRAGKGMLDGMARLLPTAEIGFLGMIRDELTLQATTYATRLPDDLTGRQCYLLDPMLATGGTLAAAIRFVADRGAGQITAVCLLAAPRESRTSSRRRRS